MRGSRSLIFNLCNAIQSVRCPALSSRRLSFQCKDFLPESLVCNFRAWGWLNRQSIIGFCYKRIAPPLSRSWFRIIHYTVLVWSTHSQTPVVISNHCGKAQHAHSVHLPDLQHAPSAYLCLDNLGGEFTHCIHQPPFQTLGKITDRLCKCACKEVCRVTKAVPHCLYKPLF